MSSIIRVSSRRVFFGNLRIEKNSIFLGIQRSKEVYLDLKNQQIVSKTGKFINCKPQSSLKKLTNSTLY